MYVFLTIIRTAVIFAVIPYFRRGQYGFDWRDALVVSWGGAWPPRDRHVQPPTPETDLRARMLQACAAPSVSPSPYLPISPHISGLRGAVGLALATAVFNEKTIKGCPASACHSEAAANTVNAIVAAAVNVSSSLSGIASSSDSGTSGSSTTCICHAEEIKRVCLAQ